MYDPHDTIAAIASAVGNAARGILRVSGPKALDCVGQLVVTAHRRCDRGSVARQLRRLTASALGRWFHGGVPCSLLVWPTAQLHAAAVGRIHTVGSPPILQAMLSTLCRRRWLAAPGEFTLRAFLAGRLDLTQAEGVLGAH